MFRQRMIVVLSLFSLITLPLLAYTNAAEKKFTVIGNQEVQLSVNDGGGLNTQQNLVGKTTKTIKLIKIKLSPAAKKYLSQIQPEDNKNNNVSGQQNLISTSNLPKQVDLTMNHVPVLDQGRYGTCATFASTAALDAAYSHGDYISQLCSLNLSLYLHSKHPDYPSGWDGSTTNAVYNQIKKYGIISKDYQKTAGCGGDYEYPIDIKPKMRGMSEKDFLQHHEDIMKLILINTILKDDEAFSDNLDVDKVLADLKNNLAHGHRVTIAFMLDARDDVGATASHKNWHDTWMLTDKVLTDLDDENNISAHALVVTGYDDDATANSTYIREKGLLKLRNSWGEDAGDSGNYYMTYNYFKCLVLHAEVISASSDVDRIK